MHCLTCRWIGQRNLTSKPKSDDVFEFITLDFKKRVLVNAWALDWKSWAVKCLPIWIELSEPSRTEDSIQMAKS